ncbi:MULTISPECIES: SDR family oxidoreductase [Sphingosinicellaceae]|uniref:SDR family oxidoreductase n=1 Tax=Sphingosinicellaceae TaxID=2820280 RepID=UPI001C1E1D5F|nr:MULTISPECIES: SDR family oxidoreductase [Polymorphobacter]QYE33407.1 SDR family oxidoreductase [Polymorphobacter sp. PAMC 29334]UAJ12533.1 SDR family oxidoreductase [Polymorphobacter megasporae]
MTILTGKIALITGGTSGIGLATAQLLAAEGATVVITGRRQEALEAAVAAVPGAVGYRIDSADLGELTALFARIDETFGRIDVLFVNAGGGSLSPIGAITEADYHDAFDRNVKGVLFTVQMALPLLARGASIILNGSTAAAKATAGFSVYSASKAAVHAFTRNWMIDLKGRGIRINTLVPGPTATPGLRGLAGRDPAMQQALLDQMALGVPMERVGQPGEIAQAVLFLASDAASFVTGSELFVDGGEGHA